MVSKDQIKSTIIATLKNYGITRAALFGSIVRGDRTEQSDIDILVDFEDGRTLLDLVGLQLELEDKFKVKVDIVTYDSLHPLLREAVLMEQEPIYEI